MEKHSIKNSIKIALWTVFLVCLLASTGVYAVPRTASHTTRSSSHASIFWKGKAVTTVQTVTQNQSELQKNEEKKRLLEQLTSSNEPSPSYDDLFDASTLLCVPKFRYSALRVEQSRIIAKLRKVYDRIVKISTVSPDRAQKLFYSTVYDLSGATVDVYEAQGIFRILGRMAMYAGLLNCSIKLLNVAYRVSDYSDDDTARALMAMYKVKKDVYGYVDTAAHLIVHLADTGRKAEAIKVAMDAYRFAPDNRWVLLRLSDALGKAGISDQQLESSLMAKAAKFLAGHPDCVSNLDACLKQYKEEIKHIRHNATASVKYAPTGYVSIDGYGDTNSDRDRSNIGAVQGDYATGHDSQSSIEFVQ